MPRLMGPRSWLKPPSIAVCFTLYVGEEENECSCKKIKSETLSRQNLSDIWATFIHDDIPTELCLWRGTVEFIPPSLRDAFSMRQGVNVILLVKFAVYFFYQSSVQDLKQTVLPECFDRSCQFNPRVRQHNAGFASGRREVETLSQKVPHVFSTRSPTQSKWFYVV